MGVPLNRKGGKWPGGYRSLQDDRRELFVIEKTIRGQRFHVSTRCHTWTSAMKQLERFEANPADYRPEGESAEDSALVMTDTLVEEFFTWQVDVRGNTKKHAKEMAGRLADWIEDLGGRDLRKLSLRDHIKPALERRKTSRQHRIIALKSFFAWLRKERHLMRSGDDCTLDLSVPQAVPEKRKRRKVVEWERVAKAAEKLEGAYRDCLGLLLATGWHVTELQRFVRSPDSQIVRPSTETLNKDGKPVLAVLVTLHKIGEQTRTPLIHAEQLATAERLRARGTIPRYLNTAVKDACKAAGVEPFTLGVMRHSVATWAIESGATPDQVAEFLNHRDRRTTLRFYADVAVPTVSVPTHTLH